MLILSLFNLTRQEQEKRGLQSLGLGKAPVQPLAGSAHPGGSSWPVGPCSGLMLGSSTAQGCPQSSPTTPGYAEKVYAASRCADDLEMGYPPPKQLRLTE